MRLRNTHWVLVVLVIVAVFLLGYFISFRSGSLQLSVATEKTSYAEGEPVGIVLRVGNMGTETVTLDFTSTCQSGFWVEDMRGSVVYDYMRHRACGAVITHLTLSPGEVKEYRMTWDQSTNTGTPVPEGTSYQIVGSLMEHEGPDPGTAVTTVVIRPAA